MADATLNSLLPAEEIVSGSESDTLALARTIGESLSGGEVLLLSGDLGTGKTVFTRGLAAGLGVDPADVTSPSFTLINEYTGRLKMYHVDLYRLAGAEVAQLGLEEILDNHGAVVVIEWSDRLAFPPGRAISVRFEFLSEDERLIVFGESGRKS